MSSITEQAVARLQGELKDKKQPQMGTPIVGYIQANIDDVLAGQILLKHKSLKKCIAYIQAEAKKKLGGNGYLPDQEVYDMAIAYYNRDDAEAERKKAEEDKKSKDEAEKRRAESADRQRKAKEEREAADAAKAAKQAEKQAAKKSQLSLFDMMEGENA